MVGFKRWCLLRECLCGSVSLQEDDICCWQARWSAEGIIATTGKAGFGTTCLLKPKEEPPDHQC